VHYKGKEKELAANDFIYGTSKSGKHHMQHWLDCEREGRGALYLFSEPGTFLFYNSALL